MRRFLLPFLLLFLMPMSLPAQQFGPQPDAKTQTALLKDRENAWRAFFANDRETFTKLVPDELLAMGWDGGAWSDRTQTLANMGEFAKSGRTVATLEFPRTVFQRYSDVVIMYSTFRIVLRALDGTTQEITGRGTEVFVLRGGHWQHTAWHLDKVAG